MTASTGLAVDAANRHGDALCILAIGVVLYIVAGLAERRRK